MLKTDDLLQIEHTGQYNFDRLKKRRFRGVSIDSRKINKDEIFFAIAGEVTDGHIYIDEVFRKKVQIAVVNDGWYKKHKNKYKNKIFLTVKDTTLALGSFAKTTTKDLTAAVLSQKYKVLKTEGNFNNHIGLPLTLLRLNAGHNFCVLEVGCNHYGEVKYLCSIAEPGYGMITT